MWTLREGCGSPPAVAPCHRNELGAQRLSLGLAAKDGAGLGKGLVLDSWTAETLTLVCCTGAGWGHPYSRVTCVSSLLCHLQSEVILCMVCDFPATPPTSLEFFDVAAVIS